MRADRRRTRTTQRRPSVPATSRVTVRRTVAALRRGRVALESLEQQLGDLIAALAEAPDGPAAPPIGRDAPDKLGDAVRAAAAALASVDPVASPARPPVRRAGRR